MIVSLQFFRCHWFFYWGGGLFSFFGFVFLLMLLFVFCFVLEGLGWATSPHLTLPLN